MIYIYELRCNINNEWHPFYVGHTNDLNKRKVAHRSAAKRGQQTLVYDFISQCQEAQVEWDIFEVSKCEDSEYIDQEDARILELLFEGVKLQNMKKGDVKWVERTLDNMDKAKKAGCKTVKEYKEWAAEQARLENERKQLKRMVEEESNQKTTLMERALARAQLGRNVELDQQIAQKADAIMHDIKQQTTLSEKLIVPDIPISRREIPLIDTRAIIERIKAKRSC